MAEMDVDSEGEQLGRSVRSLHEAAWHFVLHSVSVECIPRAKTGMITSAGKGNWRRI